MDAVFRASARKLERESAERARRERQERQRERRARERAEAVRREREEAGRRARVAAAEAREAAELERQRLLHAAGGLAWSAELQAVPLDPGPSLARGLKRVADKVVLPQSVGRHLVARGAMERGNLSFELRAASGAATHAGPLEFTGEEGFVALPEKVARCLAGERALRGGAFDYGKVQVSYRALGKATKAKFQPVRSSFAADLGDLRLALEEELMKHCCLSAGDVFRMQGQHDVVVVELEPADACSVVDTELEVDLLPSVEAEVAEQRARERAEANAKVAAELQRLQAEAERREAAHQQALANAVVLCDDDDGAAAAPTTAGDRARAEAEAEAAAEAERARERRRRIREEKAAALPPEPAASAGPTVTFMVRLPAGGSHSRRFRLDAPVRQLYDFVDSVADEATPEPGGYKLRRPGFPPQVLEARENCTLVDAGFQADGKEALVVDAS